MMIRDKNKDCLFPRRNNLEWLRLIFALQVVVTHTASHFDFTSIIPRFIYYFPGVPAFFFVSGFLIYSSYINSPCRRYFENRFLRIFPGLVLVTLGGMGVVLFDLGWNSLLTNYSTYIIWFVSQVTLGQAYNPELFRSVGIGIINGSLWTITTEIVFYLSVPLIVWFERRFRFALAALIVSSFIIFSIGPMIFSNIVHRNKSIFDVFAITPIVWGWMFGFGIVAVKCYRNISPYLMYAPILLLPLIVMVFYGEGVFFSSSSNRLGLIYFICYAALILWFAFWLPVISLPFDLSYGTYIWHAPIINLLLVLKLPSFPLAISLTIFVAVLSWFFVERPMLRLKRQSLRPV